MRRHEALGRRARSLRARNPRAHRAVPAHRARARPTLRAFGRPAGAGEASHRRSAGDARNERGRDEARRRGRRAGDARPRRRLRPAAERERRAAPGPTAAATRVASPARRSGARRASRGRRGRPSGRRRRRSDGGSRQESRHRREAREARSCGAGEVRAEPRRGERRREADPTRARSTSTGEAQRAGSSRHAAIRLDEQARVHPLRTRCATGAGGRDYAALAGLAGIGRGRVRALEPARAACGAAQIDRELAMRRELGGAAADDGGAGRRRAQPRRATAQRRAASRRRAGEGGCARRPPPAGRNARCARGGGVEAPREAAAAAAKSAFEGRSPVLRDGGRCGAAQTSVGRDRSVSAARYCAARAAPRGAVRGRAGCEPRGWPRCHARRGRGWHRRPCGLRRRVLAGGGGSGGGASALAQREIPADYLRLYVAAGRAYGVDWAMLAGIGRVECDHGRDPDPSCTREGAVNWPAQAARCSSSPRPGRAYGVDGDGDGRRRPLGSRGRDLSARRTTCARPGRADQRRAIFAYNHADWYVDAVRGWARGTRRGPARSRWRHGRTAQVSPKAACGWLKPPAGETTPVRVRRGERERARSQATAMSRWSRWTPRPSVQAMVVAGNELQGLPYGPAGHPDPRGAARRIARARSTTSCTAPGSGR